MAKPATLSASNLFKSWPRFPPTADKYARGVVGIDTGSPRYPGAGILSCLGALNTGAGFVRYCGPAQVRAALLVRAPSVTFGPGRVDAWVAGCGWDDEDDQTNHERWAAIVGAGVPVVVDAGALRWAVDGAPAGSLMTPHAGELARLLGIERCRVEDDPVGHALKAAELFGLVVLLKGHNQCVATPNGRVTLLEPGSPWLAQAGSGDVLAGMAGTVLAQTHDPELAGLLAAGLQAHVSHTGDASVLEDRPGPYPPDRMAGFLPSVLGMWAH